MNRTVWLYFFLMLAVGTDTFLVSPLLPTLTDVFGIDTAWSGWLVSAYALGYAAFALIAGPLSDGWNRKKVMLFGMLAFSVMTALCGTATGFVPMLLFRAAAGVSAAFISPQVWATIPLLVKPQNIVKAMGLATAGLSVSQLLGVPIGSYLAAFHWSVPFYFIGAISLLLTLLIGIAVPAFPAGRTGPASAAPSKPGAAIRERYRQLLAASGARSAFAAYFVFQLGNFAAFTFIGTMLHDRFGLALEGIGQSMVWIGCGNLLGSLCGGFIVQRFGASKTFFGAAMLLVADFALLTSVHRLFLAQAAFAFTAILGGILFPLMMSALQSLSPALRGTIASLANASMYAGATVGASVAGSVYAAWSGFNGIIWLSVVCFLSSAALFLYSGLFAWRPRMTEAAAGTGSSKL